MFNAAISQVNVGTSKAFRNDATDRTIWVKGDGEVEQFAADRFSSNDQIQSIRDPRLNRFFQAEQKLRAEKPAQPEAEQRVAELAHKTLGEGWRVDSVSGPLNFLNLSHNADGVTQRLYIESYGNSPNLKLNTELIDDKVQIDHSIEVKTGDRIQADTAVEGAYLTFY